jgi:2-dehydro-3-deoxygalactonokinase
MRTPALLAIDWGTSNLRACLLDADGALLEHRSAPGGVMSVKDALFGAALLKLCSDWIREHDCALIASGMVGSRQGWREAPYIDCPASIAQAARALTPVQIDADCDRLLHIVPGLRTTHPSGRFDVMRGEETQMWGAQLAPGRCCVLPGTHSKWAWIGDGGTVERFQTFMTGELYGLLTRHGILGRLMVFGERRVDDFVAGVKEGLADHAAATHVIFAARTAGLMGTIAPEGLPDYLSGMLIGIEVAAASAGRSGETAVKHVTLIGDDELCSRYELALEIAGLASDRATQDATTRGQWMVARAAGLLRAMA